MRILWRQPGGDYCQTLADPAKDRFSEDDYEFLKFHGIYQQDDRDKRKTGKQYIYMVRGRLAGRRGAAVGLSGVRPIVRAIRQ
jgi:sulfite reductase beta subunit-like hemoprotein